MEQKSATQAGSRKRNKKAKTDDLPLESASHWTPATIKEFHVRYEMKPSNLNSIVTANLWSDDSDINKRTSSTPSLFQILRKGCDEFVRDSNAIDDKMLKTPQFSRQVIIRPELKPLLTTLADVFVKEDNETIIRDATVKRIGARMRRAFKKEAASATAAAEAVAAGGEVAAAPRPDEIDSLDSKGHKRNLSKTSVKSFKSRSDFIPADIHTVPEEKIKAIQDDFVKFVMTELVPPTIDWIRDRHMVLYYNKQGPILSSR